MSGAIVDEKDLIAVSLIAVYDGETKKLSGLFDEEGNIPKETDKEKVIIKKMVWNFKRPDYGEFVTLLSNSAIVSGEGISTTDYTKFWFWFINNQLRDWEQVVAFDDKGKEVNLICNPANISRCEPKILARIVSKLRETKVSEPAMFL